MPKFAATLASLLLIASSIGVNIARYPQVGRSIEAEQRTDSAEPMNSAQAATQSSRVETANPESSPISESQNEPAKPPQIFAVPAKDTEVAKSNTANPANSAAHAEPGPAVPILDMRPLVPVASLQAVSGRVEPPKVYDEVRRLPPVEPGVFPLAEIQATGPDEAQPYPTTSTP